MLNKPTLDFSFSGLKTAVMLEVQKARNSDSLDARRADLAASFQCAAVDVLIEKTLRAAASNRFERVVIAGGVGANRMLRSEMERRFNGTVFYPRPEFCTDNGAMIALAGAYRLFEAGAAYDIKAVARWPLNTLTVPPTS
jgi:N6-L-threonylcarbamoyladenine synthase